VSRLLSSDSVAVVLVDFQERFAPVVEGFEDAAAKAGVLAASAVELGLPLVVTEQYPKGLGPTAAEIARRLPSPIPAKTAFSCCGADTFLEQLEMARRPNVVLVGMETHVCVSQTAFDLLAAGLNVFVPVDAVAARGALDHDTALRRLELAGAVPTTAEAVAFEWVRDAAHPQFKAISKLVIERSEHLTGEPK